MGTGHSEAWDDIRGEHVSHHYTRGYSRMRGLTTRENNDNEIIGMLETITQMRVSDIFHEKNPRTKDQIFFDEINKITEYIIRTSKLSNNKYAVIRNIALRLGIKRGLIDGYFMYHAIFSSPNNVYKKDIHGLLGSLRGKNEQIIKEHWEKHKKLYSPIISGFSNFKKLVGFYLHQH